MSRRIAYLTSAYPAPSHTFIRREVAALRARGLPIDTFSIRRARAQDCGSPDDRRAREETFALLPPSPARVLAAHLAAACTSPLRYAQALRLALRHRVPGPRALVWALFHFAEAIVLARELSRRGTTHLHNHFANSGATVGLLAASYLRLPWSLTLHGISETDYPAGVLLGDKIARARFVACASHFGRAQAMRAVDPAHWPKLFVARCGVELSALPARERGSAAAPLRVLCVGRLSAEKGHAGLLTAFAAVRAAGVDAELVLIGDGPARGAILEQARALAIEPRLRLLGRLAEPETLREIARADVLVSASLMEGLPVVLIEALALGVPVVAPRLAGIPELVEHERTGLLFTPAAWDELAEQLQRLLRDPALRTRVAAAGQAIIAEHFAIAAAVAPLAARLSG